MKFSSALLGVLLVLAPVLAIPIRPARPLEAVEYRIALRGVPARETPAKIAFSAIPSKEGFVLHKLRGPETIEALLGPELHGDFTVEIEIDIAGFNELGIGANGGTPVPYFGFRSSAGKHEVYFLLSTYYGGWQPLAIQMQRVKQKVTAKIAGHQTSGGHTECSEAGYLCFVMNDTSKIRVRRFDVRPTASRAPFPLPR